MQQCRCTMSVGPAAVLFTTLCLIAHSHGEAYKVFLERYEIVSFNDEYITANGTTFKYNRTHVARNITINVHKDLPPDVVVKVNTYEFLSNEYRPFAIQLSRVLCQFLTTEYRMFYNDQHHGHNTPVPPHCPVKPGIYQLINHVADTKNFPIALPFKKCMLEYILVWKERVLLHIHDYARLDRDIIYRERYG